MARRLLTTLRVPGWEPIAVEIGPTKALGHFDESTGTIVVRDDQRGVEREIVLVHELLHAAETACINAGVIRRRVPHAFVENAAPILLALLAEIRPHLRATARDVARFMVARRRRRRRRAPAAIRA